MKRLKELFTHHEDKKFIMNIYGDFINQCGGKRSMWMCNKCGKTLFEDYLYDKNTDNNEEKEMCDFCKINSSNGMLINSEFKSVSGDLLFARLRFDLDNNQFDMQYGIKDPNTKEIKDHDWSYSIDINVCPFCGVRLPIVMNRDEFGKMLYDVMHENVTAMLDRYKNTGVVFNNHDTISKKLSQYYNTPVFNISKIENDQVLIKFVSPKLQHLRNGDSKCGK